MNRNRFLFETDFSQTLIYDELAETTSHSDQDAIHAEYARGFQDGKTATHDDQISSISTMLSEITAGLEAIRNDDTLRVTEIEQRLITLVGDLACHFASELDPITVLTNPQFGIADIIEKAGRNSKLALTISPDDANVIREKIAMTKLELDMIQENQSYASGQFELSWPDGGALFDTARLERTYRELLEYYQKR